MTPITAISTEPTGTPANDYTGRRGLRFTPNRTIVIRTAGRWKVSGNVSTHTLYLTNAATEIDLASGNADLGAGVDATYVFGPIAATVLSPGQSYYLAADESDGNDQWLPSQALSTTDDITIDGPAVFDGESWTFTPSPGEGHPVNFQYTFPGSPAALMTCFGSGFGF